MKYLFLVLTLFLVLPAFAQRQQQERPLRSNSSVVPYEGDSTLFQQFDSIFYADRTNVVIHKPVDSATVADLLHKNIDASNNLKADSYWAMVRATQSTQSFLATLVLLVGDSYTEYMQAQMRGVLQGEWSVQTGQFENITFDDQLMGYDAEGKYRFLVVAQSTKVLTLQDQLNGRKYTLYASPAGAFQGGGIFGQPFARMAKIK